MFARPAILCLAALLSAVAPSAADTGIFQQLLDSSVWIYNVEGKSTGSGVVIDAERRLVLTNYHVVGESRGVAVFFAAFDGEGNLVTDSTTYAKNFTTLEEADMACFGEVVGVWKERDLALIELEAIPADVAGISLAENGATPGEAVHSVGNPSASDALWVYSPGSVRQVYRRLTKYRSGQEVSARVLEVTSPINPGDSGSGLVNSAGELVGIISSFSQSGRLLTHAIDLTEVKAFLQSYGYDNGAVPTNEGNIAGTYVTTTPVSWPQ